MSNRWAAICRYGGIGDNLIAASPLRALKRMGYMTEMITSEQNASVFLHNPFLDKLSVKKVERDLPQNDMKAWQLWHESRRNEYDIFIHASHSCEGRHALFESMTDFYLPNDYRRERCAGSYIETVHDIEKVPYEFGPLFFSSEEEKKYAREAKKRAGERVILWVISGSRIDKVYPYAPMACARIIKEVGAPIVLMGGPSEKEISMVNTIKEHVENANGSRDGIFAAMPAPPQITPGAPTVPHNRYWPLRTSLSFALECDLVITPDTGLWWATAFEPMPKILMCSHASVENVAKHCVNTTVLHADPYRVPCWPCHRLHQDKSTCVENKEGNGAACISDISVERMVQTVYEIWKNGRNVIHAESAFARTA